jgi:hypothetical protein
MRYVKQVITCPGGLVMLVGQSRRAVSRSCVKGASMSSWGAICHWCDNLSHGGGGVSYGGSMSRLCSWGGICHWNHSLSLT